MTNVIKTVLTYPLDGSTTDFNIPFEYLARKFVVVTLLGADRRVLTLAADYRFATRTVITTDKAWGPANGFNRIEIRRVTSATDRLVDFTDGSILRAHDLNVSQIQSIHIAEEARDNLSLVVGLDEDGNMDARGRKIVNVLAGTAPTDVATVGQIEDLVASGGTSALRDSLAASSGSSLIGYKGTTVESRLGYDVHLQDFGAVCDGKTDDTDAFIVFLKHLATHGGVGYLPSAKIAVQSTTYRASELGGKPFAIVGQGMGATTFVNSNLDNTGHLIALEGFTSGLCLKGFTVNAGRDAMRTAPESGNGAMVMINCSNVFLSDLYWENFTSVGFMSYNDHPSSPDKTYHNMHLFNCYANGKTYWTPENEGKLGSGILIADMNDASIINCHTMYTSQYSIEYKNSCSHTIIAGCTITDAYNGLYYGGNSALVDERYVKNSLIVDCIMTKVKNPLWMGKADRNTVHNIAIHNKDITSTMCIVLRDSNENVVKGVKVYGRSTYLMDIRNKANNNIIEFEFVEDSDSMLTHGGYVNPDSLGNTVIYPEVYKSKAEFIHQSQYKVAGNRFIDRKKGVDINNLGNGFNKSLRQIGALAVDSLPLASTWHGLAYVFGDGKDASRHTIAAGDYYYDRYYHAGLNGFAPVFTRSYLSTNPDYRIYLQSTPDNSSARNWTFTPNRFYMSGDGEASCGAPTARFSVVFAAQGTINTSDGREKTAPKPVDDALLDAWDDVQLITFKWLDAIRKKGEGIARVHFGVIAQQVRDALAAHGIDGTDYGFLCYDEWEDVYEDTEEGRRLLVPKGSRWGIRPDQLLFVEAAYQRRKYERLAKRVEALEAKLTT